MAGIGRASADKAIRGSLGLRGATATALLAVMLTLGGCGTWADPTEWSDPTGLFSDDSADTPPAAGSPATTGGADDRFPNLGRVPPRPVEVSSSGERRQAIDSLNADRANARHTDEELRAGPADSNAPPPAPRAPVTQLPSSAPTAQPRGAIEPRPAAQPGMPTAQQAMPAQGVAPAPVPSAGGGMVDTFSSSLAQSSANTLPPNMAQQNAAAPSFGASNYMPLPGSQQLLAIIRFNNNETALGNDDKALVRKVAEYYKGVGGKGLVRVVGYGLAATGGLPQRRIDNVTAELKRRGVAQLAAAISPPVAYAAGAEDYTRRIEIYLVN
jgi:outer membrane protein OmpA-like peptidoglycan-associated protein